VGGGCKGVLLVCDVMCFYVEEFKHEIMFIDLLFSRIRWAENVARVRERRGVYRGLVVKSEGKKTHGKPRRRCEYKIKMDLQVVECEVMDWVGLAQDRDMWRAVLCAVMNLRGQ